MANASLFSSAGEPSGSVELPGSVFASEVHGHALYETVKSYLANQRQGTHKTKNRHEVSGQKSKMYRQKGTGRARAGSSTVGTRVGGGRIHGPRPRDYRFRLPVKVKRLALRSALTDRATESNVYVVEDLRLEAPSTKTVASLLRSMGLDQNKVLWVSPNADMNTVKSCRNILRVESLQADQLNAYQVLWSDAVVIEKSALATLEEVFGR